MAVNDAALLQHVDPPDLEARLLDLEPKAAHLAGLEPALARTFVGVYLDLARTYLRLGRAPQAHQALSRALHLDCWNFDAQRQLLDLELALGRRGDALLRAGHILRVPPSEGAAPLVQRAREVLLAHPELPEVPAPRLGGRLLVLGFAGTASWVAHAIQQRLEADCGVPAQLLDARPQPDDALARDRRAEFLHLVARRLGLSRGPEEDLDALETRLRTILDASQSGRTLLGQLDFALRPQLLGPPLLDQVEALVGDALHAPETLGVLAVTHRDLTEDSSNFRFAVTRGRVGVLSYARFQDPDRATLSRRVVIQAFDTVGALLGLPDCTGLSCARAYPHSLEEHDRKLDRLCPECLRALSALDSV